MRGKFCLFSSVLVFDSTTRSQFREFREKTRVIKSEGCCGFLEGENAGKGGEWYKDTGKCFIESRIEFLDAMLMTIDTLHMDL